MSNQEHTVIDAGPNPPLRNVPIEHQVIDSRPRTKQKPKSLEQQAYEESLRKYGQEIQTYNQKKKQHEQGSGKRTELEKELNKINPQIIDTQNRIETVAPRKVIHDFNIRFIRQWHEGISDNINNPNGVFWYRLQSIKLTRQQTIDQYKPELVYSSAYFSELHSDHSVTRHFWDIQFTPPSAEELTKSKELLAKVKTNEPHYVAEVTRLNTAIKPLTTRLNQLRTRKQEISKSLTTLPASRPFYYPKPVRPKAPTPSVKVKSDFRAFAPYTPNLDHQITLAAIHKRNRDLLTGSAEYIAALADYDKKQADYAKQLEEFEKQQAAYQTNLRIYNQGKAKYEADLKLYNLKKEEYDKQIAIYNSQNQDYQKQLAEFNKRQAEYNRQLVEYQRKQAEYQKQLADYNTKKAEHDKQLAEYNKQQAEYQKQLTQYNQQKAKYDLDLKKYQKEQADYQIKLTTYNREKAKYEADLKIYQKGSAEYEKQLKEYNQKKAQYDLDLKKYQKEQADYQIKLTEYNTKKAEHDKQLADYNTKKAAYDKRLADYNTKKAAYDKRLAEFNIKKADYDKQLVEFNKKLAEHTQKVTKYEADLKIYNQKKTKYEADLKIYNTKLAEYNTKKAAYDKQLQIYNVQKKKYDTFIELKNIYTNNPTKYNQLLKEFNSLDISGTNKIVTDKRNILNKETRDVLTAQIKLTKEQADIPIQKKIWENYIAERRELQKLVISHHGGGEDRRTPAQKVRDELLRTKLIPEALTKLNKEKADVPIAQTALTKEKTDVTTATAALNTALADQQKIKDYKYFTAFPDLIKYNEDVKKQKTANLEADKQKRRVIEHSILSSTEGKAYVEKLRVYFTRTDITDFRAPQFDTLTPHQFMFVIAALDAPAATHAGHDEKRVILANWFKQNRTRDISAWPQKLLDNSLLQKWHHEYYATTEEKRTRAARTHSPIWNNPTTITSAQFEQQRKDGWHVRRYIRTLQSSTIAPYGDPLNTRVYLTTVYHYANGKLVKTTTSTDTKANYNAHPDAQSTWHLSAKAQDANRIIWRFSQIATPSYSHHHALFGSYTLGGSERSNVRAGMDRTQARWTELNRRKLQRQRSLINAIAKAKNEFIQSRINYQAATIGRYTGTNAQFREISNLINARAANDAKFFTDVYNKYGLTVPAFKLDNIGRLEVKHPDGTKWVITLAPKPVTPTTPTTAPKAPTPTTATAPKAPTGTAPTSPTFNQNEPTFGQQKPTFGQQKPTLNTQQPIFNQNEPKFNTQQPYIGPAPKLVTIAPVFNKQQPTFGKQQPTFGKQEPKFSSRKPTINTRPPTFSSSIPKRPRQPTPGTSGPAPKAPVIPVKFQIVRPATPNKPSPLYITPPLPPEKVDNLIVPFADYGIDPNQIERPQYKNYVYRKDGRNKLLFLPVAPTELQPFTEVKPTNPSNVKQINQMQKEHHKAVTDSMNWAQALYFRQKQLEYTAGIIGTQNTWLIKNNPIHSSGKLILPTYTSRPNEPKWSFTFDDKQYFTPTEERANALLQRLQDNLKNKPTAPTLPTGPEAPKFEWIVNIDGKDHTFKSKESADRYINNNAPPEWTAEHEGKEFTFKSKEEAELFLSKMNPPKWEVERPDGNVATFYDQREAEAYLKLLESRANKPKPPETGVKPIDKLVKNAFEALLKSKESLDNTLRINLKKYTPEAYTKLKRDKADPNKQPVIIHGTEFHYATPAEALIEHGFPAFLGQLRFAKPIKPTTPTKPTTPVKPTFITSVKTKLGFTSGKLYQNIKPTPIKQIKPKAPTAPTKPIYQIKKPDKTLIKKYEQQMKAKGYQKTDDIGPAPKPPKPPGQPKEIPPGFQVKKFTKPDIKKYEQQQQALGWKKPDDIGPAPIKPNQYIIKPQKPEAIKKFEQQQQALGWKKPDDIGPAPKPPTLPGQPKDLPSGYLIKPQKPEAIKKYEKQQKALGWKKPDDIGPPPKLDIKKPTLKPISFTKQEIKRYQDIKKSQGYKISDKPKAPLPLFHTLVRPTQIKGKTPEAPKKPNKNFGKWKPNSKDRLVYEDEYIQPGYAKGYQKTFAGTTLAPVTTLGYTPYSATVRPDPSLKYRQSIQYPTPTRPEIEPKPQQIPYLKNPKIKEIQTIKPQEITQVKTIAQPRQIKQPIEIQQIQVNRQQQLIIQQQQQLQPTLQQPTQAPQQLQQLQQPQPTQAPQQLQQLQQPQPTQAPQQLQEPQGLIPKIDPKQTEEQKPSLLIPTKITPAYDKLTSHLIIPKIDPASKLKQPEKSIIKQVPKQVPKTTPKTTPRITPKLTPIQIPKEEVKLTPTITQIQPKPTQIKQPAKKKIVASPLHLEEEEKKRKALEAKRKKRQDFLGNVPLNSIVGIYKHQTTLYDKKKIKKRLAKDKKPKTEKIQF